MCDFVQTWGCISATMRKYKQLMNWVHSSINSSISTSKAIVTPYLCLRFNGHFLQVKLESSRNPCEVCNPVISQFLRSEQRRINDVNAVNSRISLVLANESHENKVDQNNFRFQFKVTQIKQFTVSVASLCAPRCRH